MRIRPVLNSIRVETISGFYCNPGGTDGEIKCHNIIKKKKEKKASG